MGDTIEIEKIIPHRYPFLFVDKIVELEPGKSAVGVKNVTADEWFFQGHFPGYPIMPGVLIIEALAQVGAAVILSLPQNKGKIVLFAGIDKVRFKREVKPGDQLTLTVELTSFKGRFGKGRGEARTAGEVAASVELLFMVTRQPSDQR